MIGFLSFSSFAGNEPWRVAAAFAAILLCLAAGKAIHAVLSRWVRRMEEARHAISAAALLVLDRAIPLASLVAGLKAGLGFLRMGEAAAGLADTALGLLVIVTVTWTAFLSVHILDRWLQVRAAASRSKLDLMLAPLARKSLRTTIVLLGLVQVATRLSDKPAASLLAGLGVGSLAIALAAQDTIKNFFGSLIILSDKPFELGELISVDGQDGTVEAVGFRSTKIRTLDGHLVTIPNGDLAGKTIRNIARRQRIRRTLHVTIPYDTPPDKVARAAEILKELLRDHEGMDPAFPPRVVFNEFNPTSLNLLVLYWYAPPDWWKYMAFSERLNFEILRRFNAEGIEFAFPTQTLFLAGDPRRPPALQGASGPGS